MQFDVSNAWRSAEKQLPNIGLYDEAAKYFFPSFLVQVLLTDPFILYMTFLFFFFFSV